jgi:acyl carrier protein
MNRKDTVRQVIAKLSGKESAALRPEMELVSDLGIDSPKALELLVELEEALGVEISDEDAARMETVGDIEAYALALDG